MDRQELIDLYNYLQTDEAIIFYDNWQEKYKKIQDEVNEKRHELKGRKLEGRGLNVEEDEPFLKKLLYTQKNGIAHLFRGRIMKESEFFDLIGKNGGSDILRPLEKVIEKPDVINSKNLFTSVHDVSLNKGHKNRNRHVVVNRAIAACTNVVSSTVYIDNFNKVFSLLVGKEKLIDAGSRNFSVVNMPVVEWYNKNEYLMKEIRRIIEEEIGKEADLILSSMLIWHIYRIKFNQ